MEKSENKVLYIIIGILLLIIGIGAGYIIGINKSNVKVEEKEKVEEKKEKEETEEKKDEEPPVKNDTEENEKELASGTLKSNGQKDSVEISLNGKTNTLLLENNKKENGVIKYGNTNIDLMVKFGTGPDVIHDTTYELNYNVVLGEDNREYLVVSYGESLQQYLLILNDDTRIIGEYGTHYTNTKFYSHLDDCFVYLDEEKKVYNVDGNDIFFYKYKEGSFKQTYEATLEEVLIKINNNKITDSVTGKTLTSKVGQCS